MCSIRQKLLLGDEFERFVGDSIRILKTGKKIVVMTLKKAFLRIFFSKKVKLIKKVFSMKLLLTFFKILRPLKNFSLKFF